MDIQPDSSFIKEGSELSDGSIFVATQLKQLLLFLTINEVASIQLLNMIKVRGLSRDGSN